MGFLVGGRPGGMEADRWASVCLTPKKVIVHTIFSLASCVGWTRRGVMEAQRGIYHVAGIVKLKMSMFDDLSSARAIRGKIRVRMLIKKGSPVGPYLRN